MEYYDVLGIEPDATQEAIRAAYREWMRLIHPDRNQGNRRAEELAKRINEAYEVLSDPVKRDKYDADGAPRFRDEGFSQQARRTPETDISPREAVEVEISLTLEQIDSGWDLRESCPLGDGIVGDPVLAHVPKGVLSGQRIMAACHHGRHDVIFVVRTLPHPVFDRRQEDLFTEIFVRERDVKSGNTIEVATLHDFPYYERPQLTLWDGLMDGEQIILEGYGLPFPRNPAQRGDLIVTVHIRR